MQKNDIRPSKARIMFRSWLFGLVAISVPTGFACLVYFRQAENPDPFRCLQWVVLALAAYTACWMVLGNVTLIEGEFLFAEYGGNTNRLQRLLFRDGRVWVFSDPPDIPLWTGRKPGCALYVAVCENFLGRVNILYRMVNLYNGQNEWFDDDSRY